MRFACSHVYCEAEFSRSHGFSRLFPYLRYFRNANLINTDGLQSGRQMSKQ